MQGVDRVMAILNSLSDNPEGLGVAEIGDAQGLPRSTVHRILRALIQYRLVTQDERTKRYKLGLGILKLSVSLLNQNQLRSIAMPHLNALARTLGETVYVCVLDSDEALCIAKVDGSHGLRYLVEVGRRMPFNCTAAAKALLAYLPAAQIRRVLEGCQLERFTDRTITDRDELLAHLSGVRSLGYAQCDGEMELGVRAVAVPVFGADRGVVASITVIGPAERFSEAFVEQAVQECRRTSDTIEEELQARSLAVRQAR